MTAKHRSEAWLRIAASGFAAAVLVHNGDHLRRGGDSVAADVFVIGTLAMILEVGVVGLVLMRHRLGPPAALAVGASLAVGYLLVHLAPERSWLSDSLGAGDGITWFSWVAVLGLIAASLLLAATGWFVLRGRHSLTSSLGSDPTTGSALHPVTVVMAIGNLVVLAGSVATR